MVGRSSGVCSNVGKGDSPPDRSYKVLEYKHHPDNYPKRIVNVYD